MQLACASVYTAPQIVPLPRLRGRNKGRPCLTTRVSSGVVVVQRFLCPSLAACSYTLKPQVSGRPSTISLRSCSTWVARSRRSYSARTASGCGRTCRLCDTRAGRLAPISVASLVPDVTSPSSSLSRSASSRQGAAPAATGQGVADGTLAKVRTTTGRRHKLRTTCGGSRCLGLRACWPWWLGIHERFRTARDALRIACATSVK